MNNITEYLLSLESILKIKILYASEVGSRAYGYSKSNSDYDVRFIYKRNLFDYLSIIPQKDTITLKFENMDIVGIDIHKICQQIYKGHSLPWEILYSTHEYINCSYCLHHLKKYEGFFLNKSKLKNNYYYTAKNCLKIFSHSTDEKKIKNYCFISSAILKIIYIELENTFPFRIDIFDILENLSNQKQYAIPIDLLTNFFESRANDKKISNEDIEDLEKWIISTLQIFEPYKMIDSFDKIDYNELEIKLNKIIYNEIIEREDIPWMESKTTQDADQKNITSQNQKNQKHVGVE